MSDDGYDSMDAERDREYRLTMDMLSEEAPPTASLFDPEEEPPCLEGDGIEPERHDHEILVSDEGHDPVGLICSCGKRYRVVPE